MKTSTFLAFGSLFVSFGWATSGAAADGAAGQKLYQSSCAACHKLNMPPYAGKSESALETDIKGIVAGTIKHPKKLSLSPADIADLSTYIASNDGSK